MEREAGETFEVDLFEETDTQGEPVITGRIAPPREEREGWSKHDAAEDAGYYHDPEYRDTVKIFLPYKIVTPQGVGLYAGSWEDVQAEACRRAEIEYAAAAR